MEDKQMCKPRVDIPAKRPKWESFKRKMKTFAGRTLLIAGLAIASLAPARARASDFNLGVDASHGHYQFSGPTFSLGMRAGAEFSGFRADGSIAGSYDRGGFNLEAWKGMLTTPQFMEFVSFSGYAYRDRLVWTDVGAGGSINMGPLFVGGEWVRSAGIDSGAAYLGYTFEAENATLIPLVVFSSDISRNAMAWGGGVTVTYSLSERFSFTGRLLSLVCGDGSVITNASVGPSFEIL
jgi:hypothetical protein